MIRACFFDCFDVLYVKASHAYFDEFPDHQQELHDLNIQADHGFIDRDTYITAVSKITGVNKAEVIQAFAHEYIINQPLIDFIKTKLKPHYKIGLISNIGRGWMQDFFDEHHLHELFDYVLLSGEEGITKPNPLIFERASQRSGILPDEILFIDDIEENCLGAEAVGMKSILFESTQNCIADISQLLKKEHV